MRPTPLLIFAMLLAACSSEVVAPDVTSTLETFEPRTVSVAKNPNSSGKLVVWGNNSEQQISTAPVNDDIGELVVGGASQGLVIRADGSLRLWGNVVPGAIDSIPDEIATGRYVDAYLSLSYLQAIRNNHSIATWGTFVGGASAAPPAGLRAVDIAGGSRHGIAIEVNGRLETWGTGSAAVTPPSGKFAEVGGRTLYSIALRVDGTLFGWGTLPGAPDTFASWTDDGKKHFFFATDRFVSIAAGNNHILALRADGSVAGWGTNDFGQLVAPSGVQFTAIAAGNGYSIGLDKDGAIHHWGDTANGLNIVPSGRFVSIAAGARHASALRADISKK